MKTLKILSFMFMFSALVISCGSEEAATATDAATTVVEEGAETVEGAAEATGEAVEGAAEATGEAVEGAVEDAGEAVDEATEAVDEHTH